MSDITNANNIMSGRDCETALATDPFTALKAHFGMLLGVADFQTIDAYHRGKQWLHSAWLHRQGIIWGFEVTIDAPADEIRVAPGLAVDALGRELYLPQPVCLNLPAWLEQHGEESEVQDAIDIEGSEIKLRAHLLIQFKACLSRQVPALMEPCDGGGATAAYSRVLETVEVLLKPGPAPLVGSPDRELPYHRLRLLFDLEDAIEEEGAVIQSDQDVVDRRSQILSLVAAEQPRAYLDAFREFAALESIGMGPAQTTEGETLSFVPGTDPAPLVVADLSELLVSDQDFLSGEVDNLVRDTHVATATIQELLCGPLFTGLADGEPPVPPPVDVAAEDAGGPRIDGSTVELEANDLRMTHTGPRFLARSLAGGVSVFVSAYGVNSGWSDQPVDSLDYDPDDKRITINLAQAPNQELVRVVIKGTGLTPALATLGDSSRVPLAGEVGGSPGGRHEGNDFIHMIKLEG